MILGQIVDEGEPKNGPEQAGSSCHVKHPLEEGIRGNKVKHPLLEEGADKRGIRQKKSMAKYREQ